MKSYGIYGYEISKRAEFDDFNLIPLTDNYTTAKERASDLNSYHLTGFLEINGSNSLDNKSLLFDLQGVLSFIDQKNVIITNELRVHESYNDLDEDYPRQLTALKRINGGGGVILGDTFSPTSRKNFIVMALAKLKESDIEGGPFRTAFFKSIEVFRGSDSFIDFNYYLLFSALESLARFHLDDYKSSNCSTPIAKFLKPYGFDISQDNVDSMAKAVSTYARIRNALFHNGKLECEVNINGRMKKIDIFDYYSQFSMLIPLVLIKYIGFDDGHINWNCWLDRMPFK
ncbi:MULTISPECIES: hypothetical protein [unclassified Halomonas]|uniref:hypothetical protein n=1 Tax=unclassified Halomonas TaxID=2609666 RepID=UPI000C9724CA|nr:MULTISPECIES: hypothetical protein [unclassified Halomonas]MAR73479.1 hypothetical protein [Halomonas sp.]|tara:strand:+ start:1628 stop:2485 length:858 start_codon:yes stop_codon:yes gene_type:complete